MTSCCAAATFGSTGAFRSARGWDRQGGLLVTLHANVRRHDRFRYFRRTADMAHVTCLLRDELVECRAVLKPGIEFMPLFALQVVADHNTLFSRSFVTETLLSGATIS